MSRQNKIQCAIRSVVSITALALWLLLNPATATSDHGATQEYQVKAAFIYNFVRFTDWPTSAFKRPTDPIYIAVVGHSNLGDAFAPFLEKPINGRNIVVVHKKETDPLGPCHVVFFTRCEHQVQDSLLSKLAKVPVLTVGERPGFTQSGGMVNFFMQDRRIRFEINPGVAEQAGMKISSKLLQLAIIVENKGPQP